MSKNIIELTNLSKFYGKHRGIEDITFAVEEGEIFGFIGPNGAGKSTTIRTLLALIKPSGGSAKIFDMDIIADAPKIAKDVGYLPSETFYYEQMKVKDLLNYAADLYQKDCSKRISDLTEKLHLDVNRKIRDLSFGNKKKVGIVQGLLHSPKLLILDEPSSGLDPLMQQTFFEILREENKKGVTILLSSHILSEVQKMCNRVAILKEGKLVSMQSIHELRENGYKKIILTTQDQTPAKYFDIKGVTNYINLGDEISFMFNGNVRDMLMKISKLNITDIYIEEPTLEEIFLHYYK